MSDSMIHVEDLGKRYRLGELAPYRTLRESIRRCAAAPVRWATARRQNVSADPLEKYVWALRDVSFDVGPGEVIGVIGRNGAGKSTLLKILTKITKPTEGRAEIAGRVGSLLEVGTGFHPELTGRENVFLNGAILGMTRAEIKHKFDQIVDFSGVETFLDTPVKRFSSGMQVRLAFAVAAHLDPEILLVDEVLAVGDAEFQKKCLGKMSDVARCGRTILFVSHNIGAVSRLCTKAILLDGGRQQFLGNVDEAVGRYLHNVEESMVGYADLRDAAGLYADRRPQILWVSTHDESGNRTSDLTTGRAMSLRVGYELQEPIPSGYLQINIFDRYGNRATSVTNTHGHGPLNLGRLGTIECRLDDLCLAGGEYFIDLSLGTERPRREALDYVPSAISIRIDLGDYLGGGQLAPGQGVVAQRSQWTLDTSDNRPETPPADQIKV